MRSIVVHYQEIALKGKNRPWFMAGSSATCAGRCPISTCKSVRALMGRIEVVLGPTATPRPSASASAGRSASRTFPMPAGRALDLDGIAAAILQDLGDRTCGSFRVSVRRADKRFPLTSPQVEREIGGRIKEARGWRVDLERAELVIHVELLTDEAFYFFGKETRRRAGFRPAPRDAWPACCPAGSTRPSRRTG